MQNQHACFDPVGDNETQQEDDEEDAMRDMTSEPERLGDMKGWGGSV